MMGITSKHRHRRRTTGGGKRWRKKNAHTERHESKSGMDTSMRNVVQAVVECILAVFGLVFMPENCRKWERSRKDDQMLFDTYFGCHD